MTSKFLLQVADVLEKAAAYIDEVETTKATAAAEVRTAALKDLSDKFSTVTGESLSTEIREKLSASDDTVLSAVNTMLEMAAAVSAVESLGRSSEKNASGRPLTKKEAAEAAWDSFGNFINS